MHNRLGHRFQRRIDIPVWLEPKTAAPPPVTTTLTATDDCLVNANQPDRNYGVSTTFTMWAGTQYALFRFDFSGLSGTVISATLRLYVATQDPDNVTHEAYEILVGNDAWWPEGTGDNVAALVGEPDWNHKEHAGTNWAGSAGLETDGVDIDGTAIASWIWNNPPAGTELGGPLTISTVQGWVDDPNTHYGILVKPPTVGFEGAAYHSSEAASAALRPQIDVVI